MVAAKGQATFEFVVDALPTLAPPGLIEIDGFATFVADGGAMSSTPSETPLSLPLSESNPVIVVNTTSDQNGGGDETSFREALVELGP